MLERRKTPGDGRKAKFGESADPARVTIFVTFRGGNYRVSKHFRTQTAHDIAPQKPDSVAAMSTVTKPRGAIPGHYRSLLVWFAGPVSPPPAGAGEAAPQIDPVHPPGFGAMNLRPWHAP